MPSNKEGNIPAGELFSVAVKAIDYLSTSEEERIEDEKWHKQREKDEAEATRDAEKNAEDGNLPKDYPMPPKLPYPVPPGWDWRKAKREEERHAQKKRKEEGVEAESLRDDGSDAPEVKKRTASC